MKCFGSAVARFLRPPIQACVMGFDLGSAVNGAADWVCNAPLVRGIVSNPIFTALLIVALAAIVVMALYHAQIKKARLKRGVKAFIYVFLIVLAVVFVHHYAVVRTAQLSAAQKGLRDVFSTIEQSRLSSAATGGVPVLPMGYEGGNSSRGRDDAGLGAYDEGPVAPARADNVGGLDDLVIEDAVVPAVVGPGIGRAAGTRK